MSFVIALVSEYDNFWDSYEEFLGRDCGAGAAKTVENAMDIIQVLPNKLVNLGIVLKVSLPVS